MFIAGGIGITPFRSMIKYLLDIRQRRPIVLFYVNKTVDDIVYQDVFDRARQQFGLKTIYSLTDKSQVPPGWKGEVGHITPELIKAAVPDYKRCVFYISGRQYMVDSSRKLLRNLKVDTKRIKTDYFQGLA